MRTAASVQAGTYTVQFERLPPEAREAASARSTRRLPRVTRLLVLAHKIDGMIRSGEIRDWADAARLTGVTRARMTQIANLLLLAPDIQEMLLEVAWVQEGRDPLNEHSLRQLLAQPGWPQQQHGYKSLLQPKRPVMEGAPDEAATSCDD